MAKLLTPLNLGMLALDHRVIVLRPASVGGPGAHGPASGGLLIQELPFAAQRDVAAAWLTEAKACRRVIARLHARQALCVAQVNWTGGNESEQWRRPAAWARDAGFDGLELDAAGIAPAGLAALEDAAQAALETWGPDRVGIRIAPFAWMASREDASAAKLWGGLLGMLAGMELAYIHIAGTFTRDRGDFATSPLGHHVRSMFRGLLIASGAYTPEAAVTVVERRWADAVGFELIVGRGDDLVASVTASVAASAGQPGAPAADWADGG